MLPDELKTQANDRGVQVDYRAFYRDEPPKAENTRSFASENPVKEKISRATPAALFPEDRPLPKKPAVSEGKTPPAVENLKAGEPAALSGSPALAISPAEQPVLSPAAPAFQNGSFARGGRRKKARRYVFSVFLLLLALIGVVLFVILLYQ